MVNDPQLQTLVRSMQAIWEFDPFELSDFFQTCDWLMAVKAGSFSTQIPDVAVIELCPDTPAAANQEYLQNARYIARLAQVPLILLCTGELSAPEKAEMLDFYGAKAVISKPLPGLFELNRIISEACVSVE